MTKVSALRIVVTYSLLFGTLLYLSWGHLSAPFLIADETFYYIWSRNVIEGDFSWLRVTSTTLLPLIISFTDSPFGARTSIVAISAAALVAWYFVMRLYLDRLTALLGSTFLACHPGFLLFTHLLYTENAALLLIALFILALHRMISHENLSARCTLWVAVTFLLMVLLKTSLLIWCLPALLWTGTQGASFHSNLRQTFRVACCLLPGVMVHLTVSSLSGNEIGATKLQDISSLLRTEPLLNSFQFIGPTLFAAGLASFAIALGRRERVRSLAWFAILPWLTFHAFAPFFPYYALLFLPLFALFTAYGTNLIGGGSRYLASAFALSLIVIMNLLPSTFWVHNPNYFNPTDNVYALDSGTCTPLIEMQSSCAPHRVPLPFFQQTFNSECVYSASFELRSGKALLFLSYVDDYAKVQIDGAHITTVPWSSYSITPLILAPGRHEIEMTVFNSIGIGGIGQALVCGNLSDSPSLQLLQTRTN